MISSPLITTIIVAALSSITTFIAPRITRVIRQYYMRIKPKMFPIVNLRKQVNELQSAEDNRERNLRAKIRKEVDLYLNELRND